MNNRSATILLAELAGLLGMPTLTLDQEGNCPLLIDDSLPLLLRCEQDTLLLLARLPLPLPAELNNAQLVHLLSTAFNPVQDRAPGIGWHQELGVTAYRRYRLADTTATGFAHKLTDFITWVKEFPASLP